MKTFIEYVKEQAELDRTVALDEGMFDKIFQKAMEKLAVLIGPDRMEKLVNLLSKWEGKKIDKKALKDDLDSSFKSFKLDGNVAKEIQSECVDEGEELNETIANMLIAANYGFWTAVMIKAALGIGIPMVLAIIRAAMKKSASERRGKNPFANAKRELDSLNRQMR